VNGHGGARPNSGYPRTSIDVGRARSLRQQGISFAEIGRRFGVSAWVIRNALGVIQRR
jgi:hypothetical protein